jgi:MFS-type transporter involved in bile tolerance (Atg22 family)
MASIFIGPALLELASLQAVADCTATAAAAAAATQQPPQEELNYDYCDQEDARVYGMKPSSLLTNIGTIASLVSTVLLPVVGVVVDYTPYRRHVGMYTAAGVTIIKLLELGLSSRTWFLVAWLQVLAGVLYQIHTASVYAYSSELSKQPTVQSEYQSQFFLVMYISMLLYMLGVLIPGQIMDFDDVAVARWAILVTFVTCLPLFTIAWTYLFRDKPPVSMIRPNESLLSVGFLKLHRTYEDLSTNYRPVKIFLMGCAWSEAANTALVTIATTFMSEFMAMNSLEIGMVLLVVLIAGMPGTTMGNYMCKRYDNPVLSAKVCLVLYIAVTLTASIFLRPGRKNLVYIFGFLWGICQGWMHPQVRLLFII